MHTTEELSDIKRCVERAAYVIDPHAVAEALLRRAASERAERVAGFDRLTRSAV